MSFSKCIVYIRAQGMKRDPSFLVSLTPGHFGTAQTARDKNLYTFCSHPHGGCYRHFDGTAVGNLAFKLTGYVVCNNVGIKLRALYLEYIYLNLFLGNLLEFFLKLVYLLSAFADNNTRAGCVDCYGYQLEGSLNDNL